jgi:MFS transporter, DHA1 family, multidrug resistance protein
VTSPSTVVTAPTTRPQAVGRALAVVLSLLTVFGPISMDLYLPVLPALTGELRAATSTAQLTITACLLGLALGQLVAGPLSDRFGRRRPLLIGVVAYVAVSLLCAASPTVETLVVARFVQGLAGGVGVVIAQAAGRDLYSGGRLLRYYGRLTVLAGLAAIVGPVIGGQLASVTDWRGIFVFLAAVGAAILVVCLLVFRETLPAERRIAGGLAQTGRDMRRLLSDRVFLGAVLVTGFVNAALFAYLSGATFVLQGVYGLSPQGYSFAFGLNSLGFMVFGFAAGRTSERWSEKGTLLVGIAMCVAGAGGLVATAVSHLPLVAVIVSLFTMVSGVAVTTPPATSLALADYPDIAGTASSFLGVARFAFGGLAAPLVGLGVGVAPLASVTLTAAVLGALAYVVTVRQPRPGDDARRCRRPRADAGGPVMPRRPRLTVRARVVAAATALAALATAGCATSDGQATTTLEDNPASRDLVSMLPVTIPMGDLFGREKPGPLPRALTGDVEPVFTYQVGQLAYWPPNHDIVIADAGDDFRLTITALD